MASPNPKHGPEAVLEHLDWVQALAHRLCEDGALAEDLSQETLLSALRRPPSSGRPLRRWLAGVLRNLVRQSRRSEGRRARREAHAARDPELPSTLELVARVSDHRELMRRVVELQDPYRHTLLLRYVEGIPPAEIARRTGVPEATVKTRLRRALDRLRAELGAEDDGARRWLPAGLPFLPRRSGALPGNLPGRLPWAAPLAATAMSLKILFASVTVVFVGTGAWYALTRDPGPEPRALPRAAASPSPTEEVAQLPRAEGSERPTERRVLEATGSAGEPAPTAAPAPEPEPARRTVRGRVVGPDQRPQPDVEVVFRAGGADRARAVSAADGSFALSTDTGGGPGRVESRDERFATVMYAEVGVSDEDSGGHTLVVAPRGACEGRVVDSEGRGVAEARVRWEAPLHLRHRFDAAIVEASLVLEPEVVSDDLGTFRLENLPRIAGGRLTARRVGYLETSIEWDPQDPEPPTLVLAGVEGAPSFVVGRVSDATGAPVEAAYVGIGRSTARTDAAGRFQVEAGRAGGDASTGAELVALKAGFRPARVPVPEASMSGALPIEVVLSGEPLTIAGRVVDAEGRGLAGVRVGLADPTPFGMLPLAGVDGTYVMGEVERLLNGADADPDTKTDGGGAFVLAGLDERAYRLRIYDPVSLSMCITEPIAAGRAGLRLALDVQEDVGPVTGRVVAPSGRPLPGLLVNAVRALHTAQGGAQLGDHEHVYGSTVETDEAGVFRFPRLARRSVELGVWGRDSMLAYTRHPLAEAGDPERLELVVPVQCHFVLVGRDLPNGPDGFRLLDASGLVLPLIKRQGSVSFHMREGALVGGRSEMFRGPEGPGTLVLLRDGVEVRRVPVDLVAGEVNRIEL